MANAQERFIDVVCEMTGVSSPSDIRQAELSRLVAQQVLEVTEAVREGLTHCIFEDPEVDNERK